MGAFAPDRDPEHIGGGHHGSAGISDNSRRHMIPCHHLVEGHACIHIRRTQHPCFHHGACASSALLPGLKHKLDFAPQKVLVLHQELCRSQKHGYMGIMAAGMADSGMFAGIFKTAFFPDGQGIHIRSEKQRLTRLLAVQHSNDSRLAYVLRLIPHIFKFPLHKCSCFRQVHEKLRILVDMTSPPNHFLLNSFCFL